jgi:hypothetical protein
MLLSWMRFKDAFPTEIRHASRIVYIHTIHAQTHAIHTRYTHAPPAVATPQTESDGRVGSEE